MAARKRQRELIDELVAAGAVPQKLRNSEGISLVLGRRRISMVDSGGSVTPQGVYWQQSTGGQLPAGGFMQQVASRDGDVETIRLRNGRKATTRRWDAVKGEWKFTRLGNRYYKTLRRNYVVQVPVIVKGARANRSTYTYKAHLPVEKLGLRPVTLPLNMTTPERDARVREIIEQQLPDNGILYEVSEEVWVLTQMAPG
jgi:hypothetical protein